MKVLHFFKTYLPDSFHGAERVIWEIAEATHKLGVDTQVLSLSSRPDLAPTLIGQHVAHKSKLDFEIASTGFSFGVIKDFSRLARTVDVVHYHFPWPFADAVHFLTRMRKPSVVTYHSDIVRQRRLLMAYSPMMNAFLGDVDRIVATSPQYFSTSATLQRYAGKTSVIPIGIEDQAPPPDVGDNKWHARFPGGYFLFVGALRYYKGLTFLAEAARLTGLPVLVAGEGGMHQALHRDRPANLHLLGDVAETDKAELLAGCTAFVFPSHLRSEAFGVALLEAARAGKAMISCEIGTGTSFVNVDGVTGITVPPGDPVALAEAMRRLWRDTALATVLGSNARKRYLAHFTSNTMAEAYVALYRQLLEPGASASPRDSHAGIGQP